MNVRILSTLKYLCLLSILFIAFSGAYTARGLYADGSFFLFSILNKEWFIADEAARYHAQLISQFPVILLLKLGVHDLNLLIRSYSIGLIFFPLIFWLNALLLHLKSNIFWVFIIGFSCTYLSSGFFAVGEYNFVHALSAFCAAILFTPRLSKTTSALLFISAFLLIRCYEAMIFMGPLLTIFAAYRLFNDKDNSNFIKILLAVSCLCFIISFFIALNSILHPHSPGNLAGALNFRILLKNNQFIYLVLMTCLWLLSLRYRSNIFVAIVSLTTLLTSLYFLSSEINWNAPNQYYDFRTASGLFLFFILSISGFLLLYSKTFDQLHNSKGLAIVSLLLFASLSYVTINHTIQYLNWTKKYQVFAINNSGLTPIDQIITPDFKVLDRKFNWPWTNPTLSILLRGNADAIILNQTSYTGWQPFDPNLISPKLFARFYRNKYLY